MSHLNEFIVYLWLVPAALQLLLPLLVLGCWLVARIPASLMKKTVESEVATAKPSAA